MLTTTLLRILADRNNFLAFISGIIGFVLFLLAAIAPIFAWMTCGFFLLFSIYFGYQLFRKKKDGEPTGDWSNPFMDDMDVVMKHLEEMKKDVPKK